jgi:hypothetical protein
MAGMVRLEHGACQRPAVPRRTAPSSDPSPPADQLDDWRDRAWPNGGTMTGGAVERDRPFRRRALDEARSWFGDEDASRRRAMYEREERWRDRDRPMSEQAVQACGWCAWPAATRCMLDSRRHDARPCAPFCDPRRAWRRNLRCAAEGDAVRWRETPKVVERTFRQLSGRRPREGLHPAIVSRRMLRAGPKRSASGLARLWACLNRTAMRPG